MGVKKSETYKAILNFFRNTLGYDRKLIGHLVRYAVDRIAVRELRIYLRSADFKTRCFGDRRELGIIYKEALKELIRERVDIWFESQFSRSCDRADRIMPEAQSSYLESVVLPDLISLIDSTEDLSWKVKLRQLHDSIVVDIQGLK